MSAANLKKAREEAAALEARLIILRSRARSGARSMQDRGTGRAARDYAGASWAEARREAEKVERELGAAQKRVRELETKHPVAKSEAPRSSKPAGKKAPGLRTAITGATRD